MDSSSVTTRRQVTIPRTVRREPGRVTSGFGMLKVRRRHLPAEFDVATLLSPKRWARS